MGKNEKIGKPERTKDYQENQRLNQLLEQLTELLKPVQENLRIEKPQYPIAAIVGNPRSGTTLFLQWMASLGSFSYPSNLLTRFAYAPYIGALIQKMLFDPTFDFHGDFSDIQSEINFKSDLGKSKGTLACNEFQHFFRNHMPNFDMQWLDNDSLAEVNVEHILTGLASIESAFEKPFVTKTSLLQFNIPFFAEKIPEFFWIQIKREPIYVMQSLLLARQKYYGNTATWWSAKPKEYQWLKEMDIYQQIAGQVYFVDQAIQEGLNTIPKKNYMTVAYEAFCTKPESVYLTIREQFDVLDCSLPETYCGASSFEASNKLRISIKESDALQNAYNEFENGSLVP